MISFHNFIQISREMYRNRMVFNRAYRKKTQRTSFDNETGLDLRNRGLHVVRNFIPMTECLHIRKAISELWDSVPAAHLAQLREKCLDIKNNRLGIEQPGGFRLWIDRNYSDQRIIGAEHLDSVIDAFCHNTDFINIGEYYLGTLLKVQYTMANRVEYKVQNLGSGGGWHRDNCYAHGFKCMLYLSDVTTNDGPFQFLPASHKLFFHLSTENAIGKYQFTNDEVEKLARLKKTGIEEVTANAGDLVLFDTNIIHRGKPVGEGHIRYALTNYYHYK